MMRIVTIAEYDNCTDNELFGSILCGDPDFYTNTIAFRKVSKVHDWRILE
jgi:hypothetical protein